MPAATPNDPELMVKLSRRSLWVLLQLLVVLGIGAIAVIGFPRSEYAAMASKLSMLFPIATVIAYAALRSSAKGADMSPSNPAMKAILTDELRKASEAKACRNAFVAMLLAQPLLAALLVTVAVAAPVALMAVANVLAGTVAFLASLLYYDR